MDKRWQLIEIEAARTVSGARYASAGTSAVNGDYYEEETLYSGKLVWTKVGGNFLEDSIHYEPTLSKYILTSGGTFTAASTNAKYDTPEDPNTTGIASTTWYARTGASTPPGGGALPAPNTLTPGVDLTYTAPETITVIRDLTPTGGGKFIRERDLSNGCIGYRRKMANELTFTGDDYKFFLAYEKKADRRCEEFTIRRQWKCGAQWKTFWTGTFSTGSGAWDLNRCTFSVKPEVLDKYSCLTKALNRKVNILEVAPTELTAVIWPSTIEILIYFGGYPSPPFPSLSERGFIEVDSQTVTIPALGGLCNSPEDLVAHIMWRERVEVPCVDGAANPPPGTGWFQDPLGPTCTDGVPIIWVRPTSLTWPWPDNPLVVGPVTAGGYDEPTSPACNNWLRVGSKNCIGTQNGVGIFICTDQADDFETIATGRNMQDVAKLFLERADCGITEVSSDFFEWSAIGDAPGYVAGENYVTGSTNQVDHLFLVQKSDAIDPDATNPATKGEMTLKEFLDLVRTAFQVFWDIGESGVLRFEHWKFWASSVGLATSNYATKDKVEPLRYIHLSSDIPQIERPKWAEAFGEDFVGADIVYGGPCVGDEKAVKEYPVPRVTTDLVYVNTDPDEINKDGFVMLATVQDGSDYSVILDIGALSGSLNTNAPLSWANLERDFWTWNRFLFDAEMNRQQIVFDGIAPNIEQSGVVLKVCCNIFDIDPRYTVSTELGKRLGGFGSPINATIQREQVVESTESAEYTLRYAY